MIIRYIWGPDDVFPLCHGMWPHISLGPSWPPVTATNAYVHAHCCVGCNRRLVCTCQARGKYDMRTCLWCGPPWTMTWRLVRRRPKRKAKVRRRRKVAA